MRVEVSYMSRYNGCDVQSSDQTKSDLISDEIVEFASQFCDDDGYFEGDIADVEAEVNKIVKKHFGDDTEVVFEEDSFSS